MIGQEESDRDRRIFERGEDAMRERTGLGFRELHSKNVLRAGRWHPGFPADQDWTLGDWGNAMAGEAGEACNIIKKVRRIETAKQRRATEDDAGQLIHALGKELADVIIYADLIAEIIGIDLGEYVRGKFNDVSHQYGFPEKL